MPRRRRDEPAKLPDNISSVIEMEDIYPIINYVQITREEVSFVASHQDYATIETLLRDSEITFDTRELKKGMKYRLSPPPQRAVSEEIFIIDEDEYSDEIIEDGQCF